LGKGELAFHFCFVPEGQRVSMARLVRAAGLRWPVAVTAALLRHRTDTQAPPPVRPDQPPPADPGMTPLTVPEITRLLTTSPARPGLAEHWANWRRGHQARARWYHYRARVARDTRLALVS
jgi:hypothetical protein